MNSPITTLSLPSSRPELEAELLRTDAEISKRRLYEYVRRAWHLIEPGTPFKDSWHLGAICEHLEAVTRGQIRRLIINVPPRTGKSSLVSILWPTWTWIRSPESRFMFASYAEQLAFLMSVRRRDNVILSKWFQDRFGSAFQLSGVPNLKHLFTNDRGGHMFSSSTGGQVTGYGGKYLVLDDPHDPKGAESDIKRETTSEWLKLTWPSRLDPVPGAAEVVIMQRLHENDATGLYLRDQSDCVHLKIPMEYRGQKNPTVLGYQDPRTQPGELLSPDLYGRTRVDELKRQLGPYGAAGQLDQEPAPAEGGIIKRAWIRSYEGGVPSLDTWIELPGFCRFRPIEHFRFCTIDPATSDKEITKAGKLADPDSFVIAAWALVGTTRGPVLVCLDMIVDHLEGPDQEPKIQAMHDAWKFALIGVESVGFQLSLFQRLKRRGLPVRELSKSEDAVYRIDGDKTARAYAATPLMADGRFFVPTYAPWLGEAIKQITCYPNVAHDDILDAATYAVALAGIIGPQLGRVSDYEGNGHESNGHDRFDAGVNRPDKDEQPAASDPFGAIRLAPP